MTSSRSVHSIRFGFDGESLFGKPEPHHFYDLRASAEAYAQLCREKLRQEYPSLKESEILIEYQYDEDNEEFKPNLTRTDVLDEDDYSLGYDEIQRVEEFCRDVQDEKRWVKQDAHSRLKDACRKSRIPVSVIRWACLNNLINGIVRTDGEYWFREAEFAAFQLKMKKFTSFEIVAISESDEGQYSICDFYSKEILEQQTMAGLPQNTALLIQLDDENTPALFNHRNSGITICSHKGIPCMKVDFFTEVEPWQHEKWSFEGFASALIKLAHHYGFTESLEITNVHASRQYTEVISLVIPIEDRHKLLKESITNCFGIIHNLVQEARSQAPVPPIWDNAFLTDEDLFCKNYLDLLLRRMKFVDVTYRGKRKQDEFGKDFTFSEETKLGYLRHYGLQAKDGDLSGGARSAINEIINQLDDAFRIPYLEPSDPGTNRFISEFIIAISGEFTKNAEEKIRYKISEDKQRYVHFWKGEKIRELVTKYFSTNDKL